LQLVLADADRPPDAGPALDALVVREKPVKAIEATMAKGKPGQVYQVKITLADIHPPVWRRVQTLDCTLSKLHTIIQSVMGWGGSPLWAFDIEGEQYGDDPEGDPDVVSARKLKLSKAG